MTHHKPLGNRDLQTSVRALNAMGLTYHEISELQGISRDTIATWGKGTSDSYGAAPVWKIGTAARTVRDYVNTLIRIGHDHAPHGVGLVTVRRHDDTPEWALRIAMAIGQGWLCREAVTPPVDVASSSDGYGLIATPAIETIPAGTRPASAQAYIPNRGKYPCGTRIKKGRKGFKVLAGHIIVSVPNVLLWARYRGAFPDGVQSYPWRPAEEDE